MVFKDIITIVGKWDYKLNQPNFSQKEHDGAYSVSIFLHYNRVNKGRHFSMDQMLLQQD